MVYAGTQRINQERDLEAVADGYKTKIKHDRWLADGLQKDAIQNSWDARVSRKGRDWECGFSLMRVRGEEVLLISDKGTKGLSGTRFRTGNELTEILKRVSTGAKNEDLACFINSNWSSKSSEEGGNRGRGKILFLVASQSRRIQFDSFRSSDDSYVFGEIYLDEAEKQVKFKVGYNDDGRTMLRSEFGSDVIPMDHYGTRIFISKPKRSITEAIREGGFLSNIETSWWEIIKKYEAKIFVDDGGTKKYVELTNWYDEDLEKSKEFPPENIGLNDYRIKRLVLRYAPDTNMPDSVRGIAIQRGGMTIERIPIEDLARERGMNDIYGWLEMEKTLEEDMKENCEGPEHFNFTWTINPARRLRNWLKPRVRVFAEELKLNESEQKKKSKAQKAAEEQAVKLLTPQFRELGLHGKYKGLGRTSRTGHKRKKNELLRLSTPDYKLPRNDTKRVNYGEKIEGAYVVPINDLNEDVLVSISVRVVSDNNRTILSNQEEINLCQGKSPRKIGPGQLFISREEYKPGGYFLRGRMVAKESKDIVLLDGSKIRKGKTLYKRINHRFYVEADPPESGPFEFQPRSNKNDKRELFDWQYEGDGYIIYYNDLHPHIAPLLEDEEKLKDYFIEQGSFIALQIKLEELVSEDDNRDGEFTELIRKEGVAGVYRLFLERHSKFLWDFRKK